MTKSPRNIIAEMNHATSDLKGVVQSLNRSDARLAEALNEIARLQALVESRSKIPVRSEPVYIGDDEGAPMVHWN